MRKTVNSIFRTKKIVFGCKICIEIAEKSQLHIQYHRAFSYNYTFGNNVKLLAFEGTD